MRRRLTKSISNNPKAQSDQQSMKGAAFGAWDGRRGVVNDIGRASGRQNGGGGLGVLINDGFGGGCGEDLLVRRHYFVEKSYCGIHG